MLTLRNLYDSTPLDQPVPTQPVPMLSDHWLNGYAYFDTLVVGVGSFKLLASECYRHEDTARPILFDSPRRADSNETHPASGGDLPAEVSPLFSMLTSIAMCTLCNIHYSITLDRWIATHPFPMLFYSWLNCYPTICT